MGLIKFKKKKNFHVLNVYLFILKFFQSVSSSSYNPKKTKLTFSKCLIFLPHKWSSTSDNKTIFFSRRTRGSEGKNQIYRQKFLYYYILYFRFVAQKLFWFISLILETHLVRWVVYISICVLYIYFLYSGTHPHKHKHTHLGCKIE